MTGGNNTPGRIGSNGNNTPGRSMPAPRGAGPVIGPPPGAAGGGTGGLIGNNNNNMNGNNMNNNGGSFPAPGGGWGGFGGNNVNGASRSRANSQASLGTQQVTPAADAAAMLSFADASGGNSMFHTIPPEKILNTVENGNNLLNGTRGGSQSQHGGSRKNSFDISAAMGAGNVPSGSVQAVSADAVLDLDFTGGWDNANGAAGAAGSRKNSMGADPDLSRALAIDEDEL